VRAIRHKKFKDRKEEQRRREGGRKRRRENKRMRYKISVRKSNENSLAMDIVFLCSKRREGVEEGGVLPQLAVGGSCCRLRPA
jgi:hypothetical protein